MNCQTVREQLPDYLTGNLDRTARAGVDAHLNACVLCAEEAASLSAIWNRLGTLPQEQPSPELRVRFNAMVEAYREGLAHRDIFPWRRTLSHWAAQLWPQAPALQFGIAVLFLILGVTAGRLLSPSPSNNSVELAGLRSEVRSMRRLVAVSLLQQQSASDRLKGVDWSSRVERPDREVLSALLHTLKYDSNVNVRLAAVDALHQFSSEPFVRLGLIEALPMQGSPLVQIALIDLLVEIRDKQAVDVLRRLKQDREQNEAVKERAEWGLRELS